MNPDKSPGNAVTHGLTAKKILPENLRRQSEQLAEEIKLNKELGLQGAE